jgi:hypothetical protein
MPNNPTAYGGAIYDPNPPPGLSAEDFQQLLQRINSQPQRGPYTPEEQAQIQQGQDRNRNMPTTLRRLMLAAPAIATAPQVVAGLGSGVSAAAASPLATRLAPTLARPFIASPIASLLKLAALPSLAQGGGALAGQFYGANGPADAQRREEMANIPTGSPSPMPQPPNMSLGPAPLSRGYNPTPAAPATRTAPSSIAALTSAMGGGGAPNTSTMDIQAILDRVMGAQNQQQADQSTRFANLFKGATTPSAPIDPGVQRALAASAALGRSNPLDVANFLRNYMYSSPPQMLEGRLAESQLPPAINPAQMALQSGELASELPARAAQTGAVQQETDFARQLQPFQLQQAQTGAEFAPSEAMSRTLSTLQTLAMMAAGDTSGNISRAIQPLLNAIYSTLPPQVRAQLQPRGAGAGPGMAPGGAPPSNPYSMVPLGGGSPVGR